MHLVVNPAAAGGRLGRSWRRLESRLRRVGVRLPTTFTEAPGHATALVRGLLAAGEEAILVAGGDGTICEAVQGIHEAGRGRLAVLPLGTGNDAARTLGLPLRLEEAARVALEGSRRRVDLMRVGDRVAFNAVGIGLLGAINAAATRLKVVRGLASYLAAAAWTLLRYRPLPVGVTGNQISYRGGMTILAVHNGPTTGGGFRLAPTAHPDDGWLDACLVGPVGVVGRLSRLYSALRGRLALRRGSQQLRFTRLELATNQPLPAHLDGNPHLVQPPGVAIEVLPAALEVVVARPRSTSRADRARR